MIQNSGFHILNSEKGISLISVLLATALLAVFVSAFVGSWFFGQESIRLAGQRERATFLAEEALEAVRNIRDDDFANLTNGIHGLNATTGEWQFSGTADTTDIFRREVVITEVDASRKDLITNITWQQNPQRSGLVTLTSRLTNWQRPTRVLPPPPIGNWFNLQEESSDDLSGSSDGWKIQINGDFAYVIRQGGNPDFIIYDITDPANPVERGTLNLNGLAENIAVTNTHAYIASDASSAELLIIDITDPDNPQEVGSFDAAGGAGGKGVYVVGTVVYLVRASSANDEFIIINASIPSAPSLIGSTNLGATGREVVINSTNTYAFVASEHNTQEFQVVDIRVPASPSLSTSLDLVDNHDAISIALDANLALVGRKNEGLALIDVTLPAMPNQVGFFDTNGDVNDISLAPLNDYAFLATSESDEEFQVVDYTSPGSPNQLGKLDVAGSLFGMAYHSTQDRAFAVGDDDNKELIIFAPES